MDATWRSVFAQSGPVGQALGVHLSMAHELNGDWYPWSVETLRSRASSVRGLAGTPRADELVAKGKTPRSSEPHCDHRRWGHLLKLCRTPTLRPCGLRPLSMWPDLTTPTVWRATQDLLMNDGGPRGIEAWFRFAHSIGKPLSFPEWGLIRSPQSDNPYYIKRCTAPSPPTRQPIPRSPKRRLAGERTSHLGSCRLSPPQHPRPRPCIGR